MSSSQPNNLAINSSGKAWNKFSDDEEDIQKAKESLARNDLRKAITTAFNLDENDHYVYHAIASVTLEQVQQVIDAGGANGLHKWYVDAEGKPVRQVVPPNNPQALPNAPLLLHSKLGNPPAADIEAYTSIFAPNKSAANTLKSLAANAKKGSLRAAIAANLTTKRHLDASRFSISKRKAPHFNPYLDFWVWACQNLEWAGPTAQASLVRSSHAILPVFMLHFGCVVPSYEALEIIRQVARGRPVCDIGSGSGYWAFLLRQHGLEVRAVDDLQSTFRTMWIADTTVEDGASWLRKRGGVPEEVLLMVYPIVGRNFVANMLKAYKGKDVVVAGTQNRSGYTAFAGAMVDEWMKEQHPEFAMTARVALPSFAGKDEGLFVFRRE